MQKGKQKVFKNIKSPSQIIPQKGSNSKRSPNAKMSSSGSSDVLKKKRNGSKSNYEKKLTSKKDKLAFEEYYNGNTAQSQEKSQHKAYIETVSQKFQLDHSQAKARESEYGTQAKISFNSIKGVIDFQGKLVEVNLKNKEQLEKSTNQIHRYNTYWDRSSQEIVSDFISETNKESQEKIKRMSMKSKTKRRRKNKSQDPIKEKTKNKHKLRVGAGSQKENIAEDETLSTAKANRELVRQESISNLREQLMVQVNNNHQKLFTSYSHSLHKQRCKCINMLSKLCGTMQYRRQTFALTIHLFDLYLCDQVLLSKIKILSLACLEIALKLEESEKSCQFVEHILIYNQNQQQQMINKCSQKQFQEKSTEKKCMKMKRAQQKKSIHKTHEKQQKKIRSFIGKCEGFHKICSEEIGQYIFHSQIVEFEIVILMKANFKPWRKTYSFWMDSLTLLWDNYILEQSQTSKTMQNLIFRQYQNLKNFSHLSQTIQNCLYDPQYYRYPQFLLVLSTIYLIVRINLEGNQPETYKFYHINLKQSCNALFIDQSGCNAIFSPFLNKLRIQMGDLLNCCQFISQYLNPVLFMKYNFEKMSRDQGLNQILSYHRFNQKLFEFHGKDI